MSSENTNTNLISTREIWAAVIGASIATILCYILALWMIEDCRGDPNCGFCEGYHWREQPCDNPDCGMCPDYKYLEKRSAD